MPKGSSKQTLAAMTKAMAMRTSPRERYNEQMIGCATVSCSLNKINSQCLDQDFKVSNGGPISKKISVKINRCL